MQAKKKLSLSVTLFCFLALSDAAVFAQDPKGCLKTNALFGPNVCLIRASDKEDQQGNINEIYDQQRSDAEQFGSNRYAFLFFPGTYPLAVKVGYYTQVLGLGVHPDATAVNFILSEPTTSNPPGALNHFWRGMENLKIQKPLTTVGWFNSQASPIRRIHASSDFNLANQWWSSGGFLADSQIDGIIDSASQQQFFVRNTSWKGWKGGGWNMVFVNNANCSLENCSIGTIAAPPYKKPQDWLKAPLTILNKVENIPEKPTLVYTGPSTQTDAEINDQKNYSLLIPVHSNSTGPDFTEVGPSQSPLISLQDAYFATPENFNLDQIQRFLSQDSQKTKVVIFTPGIYHLSSSINITQSNVILLGMGLATLTPNGNFPAIATNKASNIKIAGLLLDAPAGSHNNTSLMIIGDPASKAADTAKDPIYLYDIFCRVGGVQAASAGNCVTINEDHVVGDDLWLWRADHGNDGSVGWGINPAASGLIVNGNDVRMYGLFVEHFNSYQTIWNGENGKTYFYQSEMPYDPDQSWIDHGGSASYKVSEGVKNHEAWGLGVYSFFNVNSDVFATRGIEVPDSLAPNFKHMVTVRLNGYPKKKSGIQNIINHDGKSSPDMSNFSAIAEGVGPAK